jgi:predicted metal-binding membrane protein
MSMMSPTMMALMTVAMMVAMMLPSLAPTLWRYHRHLRTTRTTRAAERTTLFAIGYASLWTTIAIAMSALPASHLARWTAGAIVLAAGVVQRSRWKARQLLRCRNACITETPTNVMTSWREGCRFGVDCCLSCAAPMAALFAGGLMDTRTMLLITAAITAERVARDGARIARLTGSLAVIAGVVMFVRALGGSVH